MSHTIRREMLIPQPRERVWRGIADRAALAAWMYPNDFEPRVGHRFTFRVPPKPEVGFEGLIVRCEVLECEPPSRLVFSWSVGGPVTNTRVSFRLEPEGEGTRLFFEHSGFDPSQAGSNQAFKGAQFGWAKMLEQLPAVVAGLATDGNSGGCSPIFHPPPSIHPHLMTSGTQRTVFRWIHIVFGIPILGYIYSPFEELPNYAPVVRYIALPAIVLSGLWMWKGHLVTRLLSKKSA